MHLTEEPTDHNLVELLLAEHKPAGHLVVHYRLPQGHCHKQDLETLDTHNLHCLKLAVLDNIVAKMGIIHNHWLDLAHSQLTVVHQAEITWNWLATLLWIAGARSRHCLIVPLST